MTDRAPLNTGSIASINSVLSAQLAALEEIERLLANERAALESRDPEALLNAADAKGSALARLGELENQRRSISANPEAQDLEQLQEIATRCRDMNQRNAAFLVTQQQHVDRLIDLLRGGDRARSSSYDASGKKSGSAAKQLRLTQA